jgi:FkbM family methyltransferase
MSRLAFLKRNLRPRRLTSRVHWKRTAHLAGAWMFARLLRATGSPVEFRFGPQPSIAVDDVLFSYDVLNTGDVLSMDVLGPWEPDDTTFVIRELVRGGVFFDIGANIGWYALNVARRTPATVICFEPQPSRLQANLALNGLTNVRVLPYALGEHDGVIKMTGDEKAENHVSAAGSRALPLRTLDGLVETMRLPDPTLIKIDIEGYELFALRGAERTLRRAQPTILCEMNGLSHRYGVSDIELAQFLATLGYRLSGAVGKNVRFTYDS